MLKGLKQITKEVADLGRQLNLEMDETDTDELAESHSEESLSNEDLNGLQQSNAPLQDAESDKDVSVSATSKGLGIEKSCFNFTESRRALYI
jgi:hypothetical protein